MSVCSDEAVNRHKGNKKLEARLEQVRAGGWEGVKVGLGRAQ